MSGYATATALATPAGRDRIVIGGVNVTNFRGARTPFPRYTLTEPFAYGSTSITFPQVYGSHEYLNPDIDDLGWARKGAPVRIERVMEDDSVRVDYVGVVISITADGRTFRLDVGGRVSGRANLIDKQRPKRRRVRDIGRWTQLAAQEINVPLTPALGTVTGVEIPEAGEMTLLGWLELLGSQTTISGAQWALMPVTWGKNPWRFGVKDYVTKDVTLFTDDARVVATLTDDASEQPNTWFISGVSPDGERWGGEKYPGYFEDEDPPAYPFADERNFGIGTTDAETDSGSGIEALKNKLVAMRFLPAAFGYDGVYDQDIYDAVADIKEEAGLSDNGTMTVAAWSALFDLDVTGWSGAGAAIYPTRQASIVRKWNMTPNGNLISRNENFDPSALRVDRTIDAGVMEKATARKYNIRGQVARAQGINLTGTIRLSNAGGFWGEVDPADIGMLTSDDVASYRDIRPGMNAWLPLVAGGLLVHISGVDVDDQGATLTVDTQARNLMEVKAIIDRRRESRRDLRREWMTSNLGSRPAANLISRDQYFGKLGAKKRLQGGKWTTFPLVVGQSGTVNETRFRVLDDATEFVVAVFSKHVTRKMLTRQIGNPFPLNDDEESVWDQAENEDWLNSKIKLYAAGHEKDPCGYGERHKFRPDGETRTAAELTGLHLDYGTWPYLCQSDQDPVVWVAIYPLDDCVLQAGFPLLYALEDDVT